MHGEAKAFESSHIARCDCQAVGLGRPDDQGVGQMNRTSVENGLDLESGGSLRLGRSGRQDPVGIKDEELPDCLAQPRPTLALRKTQEPEFQFVNGYDEDAAIRQLIQEVYDPRVPGRPGDFGYDVRIE